MGSAYLKLGKIKECEYSNKTCSNPDLNLHGNLQKCEDVSFP